MTAFRYAGAAFAASMRLLPRRLRFRAMVLAARAATPFVRATRVDTAADIAMHLLVHTMTKNGTEFDPIVDIEGYDQFVRACCEGRGVMLVAAHTALGLLSVRFHHESGLEPITISADPQMRVPGTTIAAHRIDPTHTFFVAARRRLLEGRLVGAMVDRAEHREGRTFEFETVNGPVIMSSALLQLAQRCGARVAFVEIHVQGMRVVGREVVATSDTVDALTREFIAFVRQQMEAKFGRGTIAAGERTELCGH